MENPKDEAIGNGAKHLRSKIVRNLRITIYELRLSETEQIVNLKSAIVNEKTVL
jgi:hypothetical protein